MFRDPRVRGGEYGTEVDIYGYGCLLETVAARATNASLPQALRPIAQQCKHRIWQNRPSAAYLLDILPAVFAALGELGALRERAGFDDLLAFVQQQARNQSRLSGTGSELHTIGAAPPSPRPLEAVAEQGTDVPGELHDVDRENIVYVSANKYHHRSCSVIERWHRSGRTDFQKVPFESVARRVSYKHCTKCAHHFRFTFNVFPGPARGAVRPHPIIGRPAPYPMDDVGDPPWYVELLEPTGDPNYPDVTVLGPLYVDDAFAARTAALQHLCNDAWAYRAALRNAVRCPEMAGYSEHPAPPGRRVDGQDGMDIEFELNSGKKVYLSVRPAVEALGSLGWPAGGCAPAEEDGDYWLDEEDSDFEEEGYPQLVENWPGWGNYSESEAAEAAIAQVDVENKIFWGAAEVGLNGFDLLHEYKRRPEQVLSRLRRAGVSV